METLLRGAGGLRLDDSIGSVSDLLDAEPGMEALPQLLESAQGLACGPAHNSLGVERGLQLLSAGEPLEALHYLSESHSTTLRQYMIMKSSCRLAQLQVKSGSRTDLWPAGTQEALLDTRRRLLQYKPDPERRSEMLKLISQVPPEWTVIQLTAVPRARSRLTRHATPELVISRFEGGSPDSLLVTRVPAPAADHCCTFLSEFEAMLADNSSIQKSLSNDRQKYWSERGLLDDRMKSIVRSMEVAWLGRYAPLLSGRPLRPLQIRVISDTLSSLPASLSPEQRSRVSLLAARLPETPGDLSAGVAAALGPGAGAELRRAVAGALEGRREALEEAAAGARRGQVILVLDREVQRYPWEIVAGMALGPVCRLPSLALLGLCLASRRDGPAAAQSGSGGATCSSSGGNSGATCSGGGGNSGATYILNPAGDLANTEQRMGPFLEERGWSGIVGRPPTLKEFSAALTDGNIMAYCGHGSGSQYLPAEKLRSLHCNAVALLFGCSSGQLVQPGPTADPHGAVLAYLMANCPAILGNLWAVTDNTLDTYSKAVIEDWTDGPGGRSLPEAVSAARRSVASTFMAAAPVVYGLPVTAERVQLERVTEARGVARGREGKEREGGERTVERARLEAVGDRSRVESALDRSKMSATLDRSRLNAVLNRSRMNATLDGWRLDPAAARLKVQTPAGRHRADTAVDRSVAGTLADLTNTENSRISPAPDLIRVDETNDTKQKLTREKGDESITNKIQDRLCPDSTQDIPETEKSGSQGAPEAVRRNTDRRQTRIPTKIAAAGSSQTGPGPEQSQGGRQRPAAAGRAAKTAARPQRASRRI